MRMSLLRRILPVTRLIIALGLLLLSPAGVAAFDRSGQATAVQPLSSSLLVTLPEADAELELDGTAIPGTGTSRTVQLPALAQGATRRYIVTAKWRPNGYTNMVRSKTVTLRGGDHATVDLAADDPGDRVRVSYVPTPADVAAEMVTLAGIGRRDVVYEPGCGDARITIAAVQAGAERGICIDIEPARVEESRAKVAEAGFAGRVDVRQGDALDLKDLPAVTVVFLYMGDHFNLLIRPVLWRALPIGARVVSHRFMMGDWKPDKSIAVTSSEGGEFEIHRWTITDELKRRAERR